MNEDLKVNQNFTEKEIDDYLKKNKEKYERKLEYLDLIIISGKDLIKNITISSKDTRSYHENYLSDQPYDEIKIRKIIKEKIAKKSILSELDTINELILNSSFEEISEKYSAKILTLSKDSDELPDFIKTKVTTLHPSRISFKNYFCTLPLKYYIAF